MPKNIPHKCKFNVSDEDYPFLYEAIKLMPEPLGYNLLEDDFSTLEVWVWLNEPLFKWEERVQKKVEELKRKASK